MSEEEILINIKEMINICDSLPNEECTVHIISHDHFKAVKGLLDLYNKQKEEINYYKKQNEIKGKLLNTSLNETQKHCISKDKVLKAMGYEENDEEYEKLKQDDEKLLAILDTMYSEFCRLEDIEDKKVEVAVAFIEEKRDKYWKEKIREKIKTTEKMRDAFEGCHDWVKEQNLKIVAYKELLKEE